MCGILGIAYIDKNSYGAEYYFLSLEEGTFQKFFVEVMLMRVSDDVASISKDLNETRRIWRRVAYQKRDLIYKYVLQHRMMENDFRRIFTEEIMCIAEMLSVEELDVFLEDQISLPKVYIPTARELFDVPDSIYCTGNHKCRAKLNW